MKRDFLEAFHLNLGHARENPMSADITCIGRKGGAVLRGKHKGVPCAISKETFPILAAVHRLLPAALEWLHCPTDSG